MKVYRIGSLVLAGLLLLLFSGCDVSNMFLEGELRNTINGYGQGLVNEDLDRAMRFISRDYYDSNGVDYGERRAQAALALISGDYLSYNVSLISTNQYGDQAYAVGVLHTLYRLADSGFTFSNTEEKAWVFRREDGRWKITSERVNN